MNFYDLAVLSNLVKPSYYQIIFENSCIFIKIDMYQFSYTIDFPSYMSLSSILRLPARVYTGPSSSSIIYLGYLSPVTHICFEFIHIRNDPTSSFAISMYFQIYSNVLQLDPHFEAPYNMYYLKTFVFKYFGTVELILMRIINGNNLKNYL